jgi:N-acetylmuramoyl-L-alanine amidase
MHRKKFLIATLFALTLSACSRSDDSSNVAGGAMPEIVQTPIIFGDHREQLSLQYMKERYGIVQENATINPQMIVVHWTSLRTFEDTFDAFNPEELPQSRNAIGSAGALNVSSQFLIDRDGTIHQLLPETTFARHVIGLNYCAIGIENVGNGTDLPLTDAQFESNVALIEMLNDKYDIEYLIGHHEYSMFIGHPLWKESDPGYLTEKVDPGDEFMGRLRTRLDTAGFKGPPDRPKASAPGLIDETN